MNNLEEHYRFTNNLISELQVSCLLGKITPRQKEVIESLMNAYTQEGIAKKLGISQQAVSRLKQRAGCILAKLCS